jgi:hypothetical protein
MKAEVIDVGDKERLVALCKKNDIVFLGVFGSYSRGEQKERSDIDVLVRFSKRKSLLDLVRIERQLSEVLGRKVDLVTEAAVSPYMIDDIRKELKVIYNETADVAYLKHICEVMSNIKN